MEIFSPQEEQGRERLKEIESDYSCSRLCHATPEFGEAELALGPDNRVINFIEKPKHPK